MKPSELLSKSSAFPLLGAFALYFGVAPFLPHWLAWIVVGGVFGAAVLPVWRRRGRGVFALVAGFLGLALCGVGLETSRVGLLAAGLALLAVQIAAVVEAILSAFLRLRDVSANAIAGAAAGYLLLGFLWAGIFGLIEIAIPGSLLAHGVPVHQRDDPLGDVVYYSYVTLTTLGYGDIVPQPGPARSLAVLEAASGQLYIAIVVAGLIGRFATSRHDDPS